MKPDVALAELTTVRTLAGPRIRLVPLGPEHFDDVWAGLGDEENMRLTGTRAEFTEELILAHLSRIGAAPDRADWAILDAATGGFLGEIVLNELDEDSASMNTRIALAPGQPGRGYGTEAMTVVLDHAFAEIGLHRVGLDVYGFNPRAQRSYEKAGFVVEGRQRDTLFWDGEWTDSILMSVLHTDPRPTFR
ncbi:GNAT family protein [Leifsonia sp. 1010]|uniref:GNAT family N-acetyltransferase n=1 Tax=Leifsonia sp. 1010 TaxID=2817769 RepID=UPI0028572F46|nr:GNAT family protein [Leifsonia sp. 1010]MDR6611575.1 RimJ/RimL family protein N-acetyltransferase [Leifsonia sp. 1010]